MATLESDSASRLVRAPAPLIDPIPLTRTTVTAFIGRAEGGPVNEPVPLRSFDEYRRIFGGHAGYSFLSQSVQQYFLQGGEAAVVVRVANRATRAAIDLPAQEQVLRLQAHLPGSREYLRASVDYDGVEALEDRFNLVVQRLAGLGSQLVQDQELFPSVSVNPADRRYVVKVLKGSKLVRLSGAVPSRRPDARRASLPGDPIPYIPMTSAGSDGDPLTDYDIIGSKREATGLFALDVVPRVDLMCIPPPPGADLGITSLVAAERYCGRRRAMLIWDPPWAWGSAAAAVSGARRLSALGRNVLTYFPRIRGRGDSIRCPAGLPAGGAIAGALAHGDKGGVWRHEDGAALKLKGAFAPAIALQGPEAAALRRCGVNVLAPVSHGHIALCGDVTGAGAGAASAVMGRLARRRLWLFILSSLEETSPPVHGRTGPREAAAALEKQARAFLGGLFEQGALAGRAPAEAFFARASPASGSEGDGPRLRIGVALHGTGERLIHELRYAARDAERAARPDPPAIGAAGRG